MVAIASPPRARGWPIVGMLPHYLRDSLGCLESASREGDIVEMRFPTITSYLFSDPADIEHVAVTLNKLFIKDIFLRDLKRVVGDGLLTSEGEFWRRQRRLAQPAFHRDRIRSYAAQMVKSTETWSDSLASNEVRDVHVDLMKLTLDIVARTLFSSDIGDRAAVVGAATEALMARYTNPLAFVVPGFDKLPLAQNRRFKEATRELDGIIYGILRERRSRGEGDAGDLLSMLLAARDDDGSQMTDAQLRDEVMTLVLAGHETTANALAWTFVLLAQNPDVDAKLGAELERALGDRAPTLEDLPALAYLEHIVTESLRLYPTVWAIGRESIEPFEHGGFRFPKGAQIWFSQWVIQRDRRHFDDPLKFRPERWADGLAKRLPRFAYFPFGGGPRQCIGNGFAMMEATLLLATIARRFRFELTSNKPVEHVASITLRPKGGLTMRVRGR